jgi:hypothetical protein
MAMASSRRSATADLSVFIGSIAPVIYCAEAVPQLDTVALNITPPESLNKKEWARLDSNQRPKDYESSALTN